MVVNLFRYPPDNLDAYPTLYSKRPAALAHQIENHALVEIDRGVERELLRPGEQHVLVRRENREHAPWPQQAQEAFPDRDERAEPAVIENFRRTGWAVRADARAAASQRLNQDVGQAFIS